MSAVERLLSRLGGVRRAGALKWTARCPAHEDRNPSLSIREVEGRVLVHCFGGCEVHDVLAAVGLTLGDLFEKPLSHRRGAARDHRHQHAASDALRLLAHEGMVVAIAARAVLEGMPLDERDRDRLALALDRIQSARDVAT